jgi:hypothetical protein
LALPSSRCTQQEGYTYRRAITIDPSRVANADQQNFPVLISGTYSFLATVANGGHVQNANGYDIIFSTDGQPASKLDHEIESYDAQTGEITFWVRVPNISHRDATVIYMIYGNGSITTSQEDKHGVWGSDYTGVWHMADRAESYTVADSTSYRSNGDNYVITVAGTTQGKVGGALGYGSGGYTDLGTNIYISATDRAQLTLEAWVNFDDVNSSHVIYNDDTIPGYWRFAIAVDNSMCGPARLTFVTRDSSSGDTDARETLCGGMALAPKRWYHLVGVYDSTSGSKSLYVNGVLDATTAQSVDRFTTTGSGRIALAQTPGQTNQFLGRLDEVRISTTARSADWIATTYNNQNNPASFYSVGTEEMPLFLSQLDSPEFSPAGGIYDTPQTVTIKATIPGASIRYTLDGTTPTDTIGTPYTGPILVTSTTSITAIAFMSGMASSAPIAAVYTIGVPTDFYAAPLGSTQGDGSITNPWDLTTALAGPPAIKPGDTIWLRGGTYGSGGSTVFQSVVSGTPTQPIIVRQYPGERATVNGGIQVFGPYSWFWGFEILNSYPVRVSSYAGSFPPDVLQTTGILPLNSQANPTVPGVKVINLIVHDTGNGISSFSPAPGTEIYGCLTYNNGWLGTDRGHGHGIYLQNTTTTKLISDNLIFNNFDAGLHPSGSSDANIANVSMLGNAVFFNGQPAARLVNNIVVEGGSTPKTGIVLDSNYIYNPVQPADKQGYNMVGGAGDVTNGDLVMTNNVWIGGDPDLLMSSWVKIQLMKNTFYAQMNGSNYQGQVNVQLLEGQDLSQYTWDNNTYYPAGWRLFMVFYNGVNTYGGGFSGWQSYTGLDAHSVAPSVPPTGLWSYVRPNKYEPGRAHVILYNWDRLPIVSVDISAAGLTMGQSFEIRDAENFFGNPVVTGVYSGNPVNIPMTGLTVAQPAGLYPFKLSHTAPEFGAFVVLPVMVR